MRTRFCHPDRFGPLVHLFLYAIETHKQAQQRYAARTVTKAYEVHVSRWFAGRPEIRKERSRQENPQENGESAPAMREPPGG